MTDLNELADRCERVSATDVSELGRLNADILRAIGWSTKDHRAYDPDGNLAGEIPSPVTSIDAAMALATGFILLHLGDIGVVGLPVCRLGDPSTTPVRQYVGIGHTLALAIDAAALRARAATPVQVNEVVG